MIKISVIISTCDRPEFLPETLRSVLAQTRKPDEIILVNNGRAALNLSAEFASLVQVYNIVPYAGAAQARNFGAAVAVGNYLTFLDDDDLWPADYLKTAAAVCERGTKCVLGRIDALRSGQVSPFKNPSGRLTIPNILVFNPGITGSNIVIEKQAFFDARGFDPKLPPSEDKSLVLELLRSGIGVEVLPDNQVLWRDHRGERLTNHAKMAEGIYQFVRKYGALMNAHQKVKNWLKIYHYRWRAGERRALIPLLILKLLVPLLVKERGKGRLTPSNSPSRGGE